MLAEKQSLFGYFFMSGNRCSNYNSINAFVVDNIFIVFSDFNKGKFFFYVIKPSGFQVTYFFYFAICKAGEVSY